MSDHRANSTVLEDLEKKALWLSTWTIHHANAIRPKSDSLKVGGHQASSASLSTLMAVLYGAVLQPEDRVAVKPHASPIFHAWQYLLGRQTRENLENFRGFGGAQSYPSRTKDADDVDFSTGSVGLGGAMAVFSAMVQDYVAAKSWGKQAPGRMISILGDAELDEGNLYEALLEGRKHDLRNCWWFIDYNRQSLDAVTKDAQNAFFRDVFASMGWEVVELKYGSLLEAAFAEPGGKQLRDWIDGCSNQIYAALTFSGGAAWREQLLNDLGDQGDVSHLIESRTDDELARLMTNLGGHDQRSLMQTIASIDHDRPVCFILYTVKGHGLPLAGHKDNHSGQINSAQLGILRDAHQIRTGHEWDLFEGLSRPAAEYDAFLTKVPFIAQGCRRYTAARIDVPDLTPLSTKAALSTQEGFGKLLDDLARSSSPLSDRILTMAPDVATSTGLAGWVNRKGVFAKSPIADEFRDRGIASMQKWAASPEGAHIELGIAEMNLFTLLGAAGLSHALFGERLIPIGTLYDPFIERGKDALNYACYQDARFIVAATPSGITLAPEGGAHQSIGTPLIGISQDGLASFEPAFVDELGCILEWSFDYLQRDGEETPEQGDWLRDETGGSVYLRLSTHKLEQPTRTLGGRLRRDIVNGGYWLRKPGPGCGLVIAYTGVVAAEAIAAAGRIGQDQRDIGVLAITSADRLNAGWHAADRARALGHPNAQSHIETLLSKVSRDAAIVTVTDGHPLALSWLGSVLGQRVRPLGVEHFGQTGSIADLYRAHRIDADAIMRAAELALNGRPLRLARIS
ncbi:pyruvate dehydrogenase complex, dehydrogenase (E1) component [Phaeobacter gallaeciensis]|uniref:Pyruvate dehydrogenase E1 component n=1 Tax=Phaeobacter gallaeciensis TaxID=60890 RepID=A0AAC9ZB43_9RHOB|nr:pyruvate dehydrogenase complex, dehydrogenase (E1) component [Phaeobacter gallaeciensis]AHD11014.1 Pyruvate dehydrogenase complex, dehydrogenase (E1) component [Phaeobacter gallaeciensis DSM 26640]ATE94277.1 Pyruvate dehydrogenase complex, dehydrogenase (E1) component [Phaeobacter gallaeciensis]ATE95902.1 Pyruvate dehydrogenase complex, dehydrogenase (E1) component [Phaeobacter gallaeciensis]ATF02941.1 Pyruvate dehydrogenase complex, dehydrogenase (E1) component [Phaeobacter gallaeciensis]A